MKKNSVNRFAKCLFALLLVSLLLAAIAVPAGAELPQADRTFFACTDIHGKTSNLDNILSAVRGDTDIGLAVFGGDLEAETETVSEITSDYFPKATSLFVTGNHDDEGAPFEESGQIFANEHYVVYAIAYADFDVYETAVELSSYLYAYNSNPQTKGKPLFIISHLPLHEQRGDNGAATSFFSVINPYAADIDIFFLWGHNHTVDRTLYYYAPGDSIAIEGRNGEETLTFSYLTAGYVKEGYGLTVYVGDENVTLQRYNTNGKHAAAILVKRIHPAVAKQPDGVKDQFGHACDAGAFDKNAKAMKYVCPQCGDVHYEHIRGDVDGDGAVTASDARLALRRSVNLDDLDEVAFHAADGDGDKQVTAADARFILRRSVKLQDAELQWKPIQVKADGKVA